MGGMLWLQGNPCSQLIRGGNGHWSQGNCFVFLRGQERQQYRLAGPFPFLQTASNTDTASWVPGSCDAHAEVGSVYTGTSSPLGLHDGNCCSPQPSFSTRGNQSGVPASLSPLQPYPRALPHRPRLGGKEGPAQKEVSSSALCTNHSSTSAGLHCLPMQDQRCSHLSEFLLEISQGIYCHLQPGLGCEGAPWLTPGVKHNLQAHSMEQGTGRELSRKYFAENKTFKAFQ